MNENEESTEDDQRRKIDEELKTRKLIGNFFEPDAVDRLNNIQISNPDLFKQIFQIIVENVQAGRLTKKISDEELKMLVGKILSQKRESKININRK
ncbi:DNA-binding protein [uncultured archaeon]|nr:DNA-binding protein [uncultured archaeon]